MDKSVNDGKATKVLSSEELQAAAQMKEQIKKAPLMGSKFLVKQVESANTSPEYKAACEAELVKRYEQEAPAPEAPATPPVDPVVPPASEGDGGQEGAPNDSESGQEGQ